MLLFLWIGIPRGTQLLLKWMDLVIMEIEVTPHSASKIVSDESCIGCRMSLFLACSL